MATTASGRRPRPTRAALRLMVTLAVTLASAVAFSATPAGAEDLVPCSPFTSHQAGLGWSFRRCGVPDFDQRRVDLPNDGKMYCVPTSALNWMAYLAERGYPLVLPGPGYTGPFLTDTENSEIGDHLDLMGSLMGTHPEGGTKGGAVSGMKLWLGSSNLFFGVHRWGAVELASTLITPSVKMIAANAAQGSLAMLNMGWYEPSGLGWHREGGHMVSMVGAAPAPDLGTDRYRVVVNDPSSGIDDPDDWTDQSPFWPDEHTAFPQSSYFVQEGVQGHGVKDRLVGFGSTAFVDAAIFITPKYGLASDPASDGLTFTFPGEPKIVIDGIDGLVDVAIAPAGAEHAALLDNGDLQLLNGVDGSRRTVATLPGAQRVVYDDHGRLVILTRDGLVRVLPDHRPDPDTRVPVPTDSDEIAFDPAAGRLVGWDRETSTLTFLDDALGIVDRQVVPRVMDPSDPAGAVTLSVDPTDGTVGLLADGTNRLVVTRAGTTHEVVLGSGAPLAGLVADSSGTWYSTDQADHHVVAFDRDGDPVEGTPFDGLRAGRLFRVWQPMDIGDSHDDRNVLPEDAPRQSPHLEVTGATDQVAAGEAHQVDVLLTDGTADAAGRTLQWTVAGANPAAGAVITEPDGTASVSWPATDPGSDHLLVWEDIDGNGAVDGGEPATSKGVSTVAEHIATTVQVSASPEPSTVGDDVTLSARVAAISGLTPTGTVTFSDGPVELGTAVVDHTRTATLTTTALAAGTHTINAHYHGDPLFAPSQGATIHVVGRIATRLTADPLAMRITPFGVTLRLAARLTEASGTPVAGQTVGFVVGGTTACTGTTDVNGRVTCDRPGLVLLRAILALGYDAVYAGSAIHAPSTAHGTIVG